MLRIYEAAKNITFNGKFLELESFGGGHINDTFRVFYHLPDGNVAQYILQRLNANVFTDPAGVMDNMMKITKHLRSKIIENGGDPDRETLNVIPAIDGKSYFLDSHGSYWRGFLFINGTICIDRVENAEQFCLAGKAFGKFQNMLSSFPANELVETIPDFHNTKKRFNTFLNAVEEDEVGRVKHVKKEIDWLIARQKDAGVLIDMLDNGDLPLRVTHNDTKLNNVLLDEETGEGVCVIDLDTVMPGLSVYDFGDAIRFGAASTDEDEIDLSKVYTKKDLFEGYCKGFLEEAGESLTKKEVLMLTTGARIITLECGMRFLTDYLNGDTYFKIHRKEHNFDRARVQFKLVESIEKDWDNFENIVAKYAP